MEYSSSSRVLSTEYCSRSESGWTRYIGEEVDDGAESDDSLTSDARSSSPPPRHQHRHIQHHDNTRAQEKFNNRITSSVSKNLQQFQNQMVKGKSTKQPRNDVRSVTKQACEEEDQEEEDEHLTKYQQSYRTTVCSTTAAYSYGFCRAKNP